MKTTTKTTKLYIPTSTRNFNNIMSTESISPAAFYAKRKFGFKTIEKVDLNNSDYAIMLYEYYPLFDIPINNIDNYPMVIEVNFPSKTKKLFKVKGKKGTYYSMETIYLNPFTSKIIFRNNEEKITTISKSEPSIEVKMIKLYENAFTIFDKTLLKTINKQVNYDNELFQSFMPEELFSKKEYIISDFSKTDEYIRKDIAINKIKGFLYSYVLGSNKTLPKYLITIKKNFREIENLWSAIINNPEGYPTPKQEKQWRELCLSLDKAFNESQVFSSEINKKGKKVQSLYSVVELLNIFNTQSRELRKGPLYDSFYIEQLKTLINEKEKQLMSESIKIKELPEFNKSGLIEMFPEIASKSDFLLKLFNEYLDIKWGKEEFLLDRVNFTKAGCLIIKELLGEKWKGSKAQKYVNLLLENINKGSAFDIKSIQNDNLNSFAAFCQMGEDIERLERYLLLKEIDNFKVAFALWGTVFGFAEMPKTFTNILFESDDDEYIKEVYNYISKQINLIYD